MSFIGPKEYNTFNFPHEGEQHLVPHGIVHSNKIEELLAKSHDNSLDVHEIASTTFANLIAFLTKQNVEHSEPELSQMIEAAKHFEMDETEKDLIKLFKDIFPKDDDHPRAA